MQNAKSFVVLVTGFCFLVNAGSEENVSESKGRSRHHGKDLLTSNAQSEQGPYRYPVRGPQNNDENVKQYGPPHHHNHDWKFPPEYTQQSYEHHHPSYTGPRTLPPPQESHDQDTETPNVQVPVNNEIPLEIARKFDTIDVKDFLENFVDGYKEDEKPVFTTRFGEEGKERNAAITPTKAKCSVENTTITIATSDDPSIFYAPKCTRIERCNGCCSHQKLACQADEKETISVEVYKLQWKVLNQKFKYASKEIIPLERHIRCSCGCKIKPEDCRPYQTYVKENCECTCTNTDEELKCLKHNGKKYWDPDSCSCKCLSYTKCMTDAFSYDHNECKCKPSPKRRNVRYERRGYSTENLRILPLDEDY